MKTISLNLFTRQSSSICFDLISHRLLAKGNFLEYYEAVFFESFESDDFTDKIETDIFFSFPKLYYFKAIPNRLAE